MRSDDVLHRRVPVDSRGSGELFVFLRGNTSFETGVYLGTHISFEHIPHLCFAWAFMSFLRHFVIGMHLYGQILTRINELDEQWELIAELLIDAFAYKESFVFVNELNEVET